MSGHDSESHDESAGKETISAWKYDGDYEIYNLPSYEEQKETQAAFGNPGRTQNYHAYYDGDLLIGFTNIMEKGSEVSIGVGVHPSLCGRGYGRQILLQAAEIAQNRFPGKALSLVVRTWNRRAILCYEAAGFRIDGMPFEQLTAIETGIFYRMSKR